MSDRRILRVPARLSTVLVGVSVLGCASANPSPATTTPNFTALTVVEPGKAPGSVDLRHEASVGERTVNATIAQVWAVLPAVFEQLEVPTTTVDAREGVIGNAGFRTRSLDGRRLSTFLDCGRNMGTNYADRYAVTVGVMVQLVPAPEGGTVVRTVLDAYARDPSTSGSTVHCITWGSLERRVAELVVERL